MAKQPKGTTAQAPADPVEVVLPDDPTPIDRLIFAHRTTPQALVAASYFAMDEALRLVATIDGVDAEGRADFLALFEHRDLAEEAHRLICDHAGLPADALWLHLTARGLMPQTADSFAALPGWQRHGFSLFIATYGALRPLIDAMLAERREALRLAAERDAPAPVRRPKLEDTVFERHGRVTDLVDGLAPPRD